MTSATSGESLKYPRSSVAFQRFPFSDERVARFRFARVFARGGLEPV
jgi:hypothetical protein